MSKGSSFLLPDCGRDGTSCQDFLPRRTDCTLNFSPLSCFCQVSATGKASDTHGEGQRVGFFPLLGPVSFLSLLFLPPFKREGFSLKGITEEPCTHRGILCLCMKTCGCGSFFFAYGFNYIFGFFIFTYFSISFRPSRSISTHIRGRVQNRYSFSPLTLC